MVIFYIWFIPRSSSRNSLLRNTKSDKISSTSNGVRDLFHRRRPSTMSSLIPVEIPQNLMVGQQRQQIWELQFDKFPHPQTFLVWKIRFKKQVTTCSDFPSEPMLWILAIRFWEEFSTIPRCSTRRLPLPWTRSSRVPNSRRRSASRSWKPRKKTSFCEEDRSPSWSTTTFEWLALMTQYWITPIFLCYSSWR